MSRSLPSQPPKSTRLGGLISAPIEVAKSCLRGRECAGCGPVTCSCGRVVCGISAPRGRCNRCEWTPSSVVVAEHAPKREPLRDRMQIASWLSLEVLP